MAHESLNAVLDALPNSQWEISGKNTELFGMKMVTFGAELINFTHW